MEEKFNYRLVMVVILIALFMSSPFIYRAYLIHEIYLYSDVRQHVLDSVFLLREDLGVTIADLSVKDVRLEGDFVYVVIHEDYHGFIDRQKYDDLENDYFVRYSYEDDSLELVGVR